MTAIMLDVIFITALSRAFNISVDKLLSTTSQDGGRVGNSPKPRASSTVDEENSLTVENGDCECPKRRVTSSLSPGQLQIASVLDCFAATYHAAYRYSVECSKQRFVMCVPCI